MVATTTFYRGWQPDGDEQNPDQLRGNLAIEAVKTALEEGFQVVVVDGGSSEGFVDALTDLDIEVSQQKERGMSTSRRQAFNEATLKTEAKVICWTEPEKVSMVRELADAARSVLENEVDIVIPARSKSSFETYPPQQAESEQRANHYLNKVLRIADLLPDGSEDLDLFFGPRIFRNDPETLSLFTRQYRLKEDSRLKGVVKPDNYLNATFFPVMLALGQGLRVESVPVDYQHPEKQTALETGHHDFEEKRVRQRQDIIKGAVQLVRLMVNDGKKPSELIAPGK